jgi:hypothetical protein
LRLLVEDPMNARPVVDARAKDRLG